MKHPTSLASVLVATASLMAPLAQAMTAGPPATLVGVGLVDGKGQPFCACQAVQKPGERANDHFKVMWQIVVA